MISRLKKISGINTNRAKNNNDDLMDRDVLLET